jgi:protein TonB
VAWIVPAPPGPGQGFGGGGTPAPPEKKAEPEEPPEPEPKKREPRVVRPTKEERDQLPMPDAPKRRRPKKDAKPSSGLVGRDSASADSAQLKGVGVPGLGLGGTGGGGSAFDQDFEYSYYAQQMLARINQHWQRIPVRGQATAVIRFTIFKDGRVDEVKVEQSSGLAMLDRAAERAVLLADPLPPLPNSYPRDRVGVHLQFNYSDQN